DAMRRSMLDTVATMDRFLSAERLRRGKMPVTLAPVHLPSLLHDVIKTFSYQAKERGLHLQVDAPEHCNITSDRDLLSLILQNLLSNAVKYSSKGSVKLAARCGDDGQADPITIMVSDEGPGIAPERLATLFAPFTRGETHGQSGSGLGLSIARQASDLLGAKLRAESKVGDGTTFFLELPLS